MLRILQKLLLFIIFVIILPFLIFIGILIIFIDRHQPLFIQERAGLNKQIITIHDEALDHALKEIDASANAVCRDNSQAINALKYITTGNL